MTDVKNDLANHYRSSQDKYVYYIIALAVACLGFSINISINQRLSTELSFLGVAVVCWLMSIYSGLRNRTSTNSSIHVNVTLLEIIEGTHEDTGRHPEAIQIGVKACREVLEDKQKKVIKFARRQEWSLYFGVLFFVLWRILVMGDIRINDWFN